MSDDKPQPGEDGLIWLEPGRKDLRGRYETGQEAGATPKPPTASGISRLLSAAGFERSAFIPGTGRQHWDGTEVRGSRKRSWGFMVNRYGEERVSVVAGGYLARLAEERPRFLSVTAKEAGR